MTITLVDPNSTEIEHLASVDVKFSGAHLGGGIYFSANHNPREGGTSTAVPQRSLDGEAESHATIEVEVTLPEDGAPWTEYRDDLNGDGTPDNVLAGFDISLHIGAHLSDSEFYGGPSIPMLIATDPNDLFGDVLITGYPNSKSSLTGEAGVLHQSEGILASGNYTEQVVGGDVGGFFTALGPQAVSGMSGGGLFLNFDVDGDGIGEDFVIGAVSRAGQINGVNAIQAAAFAPHYHDIADAIHVLTGDAARDADDFPRMTLISAQTFGSDLTTVEGVFFHEDIYGGVNADILSGAGGNDLIIGGAGDDVMMGGLGDDTLSGGTGADDIFGGDGFDFASYADGARGVRINLMHDSQRRGDAAGDELHGIEGVIGTDFRDKLRGDVEANNLQGGGGADVLVGRRGDDSLSGGDGDDRLIGGRGADALTGGDGADRFEFRGWVHSQANAGDTITDFTAAEGDVIDLSRIDAVRGRATPGDQSFEFIDDAAFSGERGELRVEIRGENLLLQADRTGNGLSDFEVLLLDVTQITEADLIF